MRNANDGAETMTSQMKTTRAAAGRYEVKASMGTWTIEKLTKDDSGKGQPAWCITWPGETEADDSASTLKEAKEMVGRFEEMYGRQEGA